MDADGAGSGNDQPRTAVGSLLMAALLFATGCASISPVGKIETRRGDEIVVAGQFVHTGAPVVLWMDPGGYDAYRVERRFSPMAESDWEKSKTEFKDVKDPSPNRYGMRRAVLTAEEAEEVRGGGWNLPLLQRVVDQFVYHFDASGTSRQCFKVLHDTRDLSVHFMLDLDGTIYQTLDVKERAWHATTSNSRSVGIEIANIGAYPPEKTDSLLEWYKTNTAGQVYIKIPDRFEETGIRTTNFTAKPARQNPVQGTIQHQELVQFDFTPEQYRSLIRLTAALCKVLPKIKCDFPKDSLGNLRTARLPDDELAQYEGLLGHYHIQENKVDPGPAFQWEYVRKEARKLMGRSVHPESLGNARMQELFKTESP